MTERAGRRRPGLIWALGAAAGIGAGVAAERLLMRRARERPDPERDTDLSELPGREVPVRSFDGTPLHCRVVGPEDAPTIVFAHGITLDLTVWNYQWRALADRYRCVLYDQRGHGRSGRPGARRYTVEALGRDVRAVLDATAPTAPVVLVGHSMGGMSIVSLADLHPGEFGGRVVAVVLVDTTASDVVREALGSVGARVERILRAASRWYTSDLGRLERFRRRIERSGSDLAYVTARVTNFGPGASPAQVAHVSRIATQAPPEIWAHTLSAVLDVDLRHALRRISVPALVVVGDRDRLTPKTSAEALLRALPRGRGVVLTGAGHLAMMERHAAFNRLLQGFLEEVLAGGRRRSRGGRAPEAAAR